MPSDFAVLLARFVEAYRCDRVSLRFALEGDLYDFRHDQPEALARGDSAALQVAAARALEQVRLDKDLEARLRSDFPDDDPNGTSDESYRRIFELNGYFDGLSEEAIARFFWSFRRRQVVEAETPDFYVFFGKQFAHKVDSLVDRLTGLEELEYLDILSDSAREVLRQAHHCYLHGLDAAVGVLCGAVLEDTLKSELKSEGNLAQLLEEARDRGLLTWEEWGMGELVRDLRNEALHNPSAFARRSANEMAVVLTNTRAVLKVLLTPRPGTPKD